MAAAYAAYVFLRSTFTYIAPSMQKSLFLTLPQIGQITSAFPLAYGASRLVTGVLVDRTKPHQALCIGLLLAGLVNISMGLTSSLAFLTALWALNGLVQGVGAGASAKMLTSWFPVERRGFYWALWSTSANIGAFLTPIVCTKLINFSGFRSGMVIPGAVAAVSALVFLPLLKSTPFDAGFDVPWSSRNTATKDTTVDSTSTTDSSNDADKDKDKDDWKSIFVNQVLKNKTIWLLSLCYFFVYFIRSGTKSWLHFWLVESLGLTVSQAGYRASGMEVGGIVGTFSAGIISDMLGGRRVVVTLAYLLLVIVSIAFTSIVIPMYPASSAVAFLAFAAIGFAINGPQMMIGLIGAEACDRRVVATATGVLGWISYMGAAAAGFPISIIIRKAGWSAYFTALLISSVSCIVALLPIWRMKRTASEPEATKQR